MIKKYKMACYKNLAVAAGTSISYRSRTVEARACSATARRQQRKKKLSKIQAANLVHQTKRSLFKLRQNSIGEHK
jgi:hypothetical protein